MNRKVPVLISLVAVVVFTSGASAAWSENFDSYGSQAAFLAAWPCWNTDNTSMALVQGFDHTTGTTNSVAGTGINNTGKSVRNYQNLDSFTAYQGTDANPIKFEFYLYDMDASINPGSPLYPGALRNFCEVRAYDGDGLIPGGGNGGLQGLIAMGLYSPTNAYNYVARVGFTWINTGIARTSGWHKMTAILKSTTADILVDDVPAPNATGVAWGGYALDGVILGSGLTSWVSGNTNQAYDVAFDDFTVTPEPTTVLLLAAGGLLLRRRRAA